MPVIALLATLTPMHPGVRPCRRSSPLSLLVSSVSHFYSDNPFNIFVALLASFPKYYC